MHFQVQKLIIIANVEWVALMINSITDRLWKSFLVPDHFFSLRVASSIFLIICKLQDLFMVKHAEVPNHWYKLVSEHLIRY